MSLNAFYVVPSCPIRWCPDRAALNSLPYDATMLGGRRLVEVFGNSRWGAHSIPGDPQGRWLMDVEHAEDTSELAIPQLPGVIALPHVYDPSPVGDVVAGILGPFAGVLATDSMLQALTKLRAVGVAGARPEPR